MIKLELKIAATLAREWEKWPAGTRVIYDQLKADHDARGGIMVRIVDPFRRPTWLAASFLDSYHQCRAENLMTELDAQILKTAQPIKSKI